MGWYEVQLGKGLSTTNHSIPLITVPILITNEKGESRQKVNSPIAFSFHQLTHHERTTWNRHFLFAPLAFFSLWNNTVSNWAFSLPNAFLVFFCFLYCYFLSTLDFCLPSLRSPFVFLWNPLGPMEVLYSDEMFNRISLFYSFCFLLSLYSFRMIANISA